MLIFVMALQSPHASKDWIHVSRLCERTLRSVCAQSNPEFKVFLVCNSRPVMDFTHPAMTIIEKDFPIPQPTSRSRMEDKWSKLKVGLVAARQDNPAFVMLMDADDCVHRDLAQYVADHPDSPGWSFDNGYIHDEGTAWIYRRANFSNYCGSSAIVRLDPSDFPQSISEPKDNYFILANGHAAIRDFMRSRGTPLQTLPFRGAVWITSTGENDSRMRMNGWQGLDHTLKKLRAARLLTKSLRDQYGLYRLQPKS